MSKDFIPAKFGTIKTEGTSITAPGWGFSITKKVNNIEDFKREMLEEGVKNCEPTEHIKARLDNLQFVLLAGNYSFQPWEHEGYGRLSYPKVKCCGAWIELYSFTNTCNKCGSDYNTAGQLLAPRHQWGEETGEHYSDILFIK